MNVAVPVCRGRVSPLFDAARELWIVDVSPEGVGPALRLEAGQDRVATVLEHAVDVLICGAVSTDLVRQLEEGGVRVHGWVRGEASEVLQAFLLGTLHERRFWLPGAARVEG